MSEEKYLCPQCGTMNNELRAEIARRDKIITRLKEDAERLAHNFNMSDAEYGGNYCFHCGHNLEDGIFVKGGHELDCPITLHRALMKELESNE